MLSQLQLLEQPQLQLLEQPQPQPQLPLPPQTKMSRRMIIIQKQPPLLFPQNILFTLSPRNEFKSACPARAGVGGLGFLRLDGDRRRLTPSAP